MQIRAKYQLAAFTYTTMQVSMAQRSNGLYLFKKLSNAHIDLTSYSRMRVDLAAEVSIGVSSAFSSSSSPSLSYS